MLRKIVFYALLAALFFLLVQAAQATNLETEHELRIIELDIEEEAEQVKKIIRNEVWEITIEGEAPSGQLPEEEGQYQVVTVVETYMSLADAAEEAGFSQNRDWRTWDAWTSLFDLEVGSELGFSSPVKISSKSVPGAVRQEAASPSIHNPHSGNTFYANTIGSYSPAVKFDPAVESRAFVRLLLSEYRLRPFVEFGWTFEAVGDLSTADGDHGKGYSYFRLLGTGADEVGYWYGVKYDAKPLSPAVGLAFDWTDHWRLLARVQHQKLELNYQKGLEAYARPEGNITIATSKHNIWTVSAGVELGNDWVAIAGGPWLRIIDNGVDAIDVGGYVSLNFRFNWIF